MCFMLPKVNLMIISDFLTILRNAKNLIKIVVEMEISSEDRYNFKIRLSKNPLA